MTDAVPAAHAKTPFSAYQKKLIFFLSVATFFEGYDYFAITQILPNLRAEWGISPAAGTLLISGISIGSMLAFFLVRKADIWGRKRVMGLTIIGYTLCSILSGLAIGPISFTIAQVLARIFLIAEWALSMVYAAEEFPAARRGFVIGFIQAFSSFGAIVCAGTTPLLLSTPLGWRSIYFIGALPLLLMMFLRRTLKETSRFEAMGDEQKQPRDLFRIWSTPHKGRVIQMALIWGLTYVCTNNAITFWKEFAVHERNLTDGQVGKALTIAAVVSLPLVFLVGKIIDVVGRRPGAVIIYSLTAVSVFLVYRLEDLTALTVFMTLTIVSVNAVLPLLTSYTSELFPTELRSDAYAWANNLLGRITFVVSPMLLGFVADKNIFGSTLGLGLGFGTAVSSTAVFAVVALGLLLWWLPETKGRELEDTSRLMH